MTSAEYAGLTQEVIAEIRKQAVQQTAKWLIGTFVFLLILAATGWWFFFEPKIRDYIAGAAGGVPAGTVVASTVTCQTMGTGWVAFTEGKGRFLVGAGTEAHSGFATWDMERPGGGVEPTELRAYGLLDKGGEELHVLSTAQLPAHHHDFVGTVSAIGGWAPPAVRSKLGVGDGADWGSYTPAGAITNTGGDEAHNNIPPYIALNFCKKG